MRLDLEASNVLLPGDVDRRVLSRGVVIYLVWTTTECHFFLQRRKRYPNDLPIGKEVTEEIARLLGFPLTETGGIKVLTGFRKVTELSIAISQALYGDDYSIRVDRL